MTAVTDLPFRRIVRRYGSGLNVTEMIASPAPSAKRARACRKRRGTRRKSLSRCSWWAASRNRWPRRRRLRRSRRGDHRHQHGLPGEEGGERRGRLCLMRDLPLAAKLIEATVKAVNRP
jgi:tRNA-dihydrouridine synthase B